LTIRFDSQRGEARLANWESTKKDVLQVSLYLSN
jgi:hypothetical protein